MAGGPPLLKTDPKTRHFEEEEDPLWRNGVVANGAEGKEDLGDILRRRRRLLGSKQGTQKDLFTHVAAFASPSHESAAGRTKSPPPSSMCPRGAPVTPPGREGGGGPLALCAGAAAAQARQGERARGRPTMPGIGEDMVGMGEDERAAPVRAEGLAAEALAKEAAPVREQAVARVSEKEEEEEDEVLSDDGGGSPVSMARLRERFLGAKQGTVKGLRTPGQPQVDLEKILATSAQRFQCRSPAAARRTACAAVEGDPLPAAEGQQHCARPGRAAGVQQKLEATGVASTRSAVVPGAVGQGAGAQYVGQGEAKVDMGEGGRWSRMQEGEEGVHEEEAEGEEGMSFPRAQTVQLQQHLVPLEALPRSFTVKRSIGQGRQGHDQHKETPLSAATWRLQSASHERPGSPGVPWAHRGSPPSGVGSPDVALRCVSRGLDRAEGWRYGSPAEPRRRLSGITPVSGCRTDSPIMLNRRLQVAAAEGVAGTVRFSSPGTHHGSGQRSAFQRSRTEFVGAREGAAKCSGGAGEGEGEGEDFIRSRTTYSHHMAQAAAAARARASAQQQGAPRSTGSSSPATAPGSPDPRGVPSLIQRRATRGSELRIVSSPLRHEHSNPEPGSMKIVPVRRQGSGAFDVGPIRASPGSPLARHGSGPLDARALRGSLAPGGEGSFLSGSPLSRQGSGALDAVRGCPRADVASIHGSPLARQTPRQGAPGHLSGELAPVERSPLARRAAAGVEVEGQPALTRTRMQLGARQDASARDWAAGAAELQGTPAAALKGTRSCAGAPPGSQQTRSPDSVMTAGTVLDSDGSPGDSRGMQWNEQGTAMLRVKSFHAPHKEPSLDVLLALPPGLALKRQTTFA